MEQWELVARERIRDTLAQYNWSGDSFRLDGLAAAFCEDGVLEVRGQAELHGRQAIIGFLSGGSASDDDAGRRAAAREAAAAGRAPSIVRHILSNTRFVELTPEAARVESYFSVLTDVGLDHYGRYRDSFVPVGERWLIRHRYVSTDWHAPDSLMTTPPGVDEGT